MNKATERMLMVLFVLVCIGSVFFLAERTIPSLDDAFIYFRIAENLASTGMPVFNIQDNHFIATSPLWVFLLGAAKTILPGVDMIVIAKWLWIILLTFASLFAFLALRLRMGWWAIWVPVPIILSPCPPWNGAMMGNEIALVIMAFFGLFWACLSRRNVLAGLFLGLGYLARGEFVLISVVIVTYKLVAGPLAKKQSWMVCAKELVITAVTAAVIVMPWHLYYYFVFDGLLPDTMNAKRMQGLSGKLPLFATGLDFHTKNAVGGRAYTLLLLIPAALWQFVLFGFSALYTLLQSLAYHELKIPFYHWYYYCYYFFEPFFIYCGLFAALRWPEHLIMRFRGNDRQKKGPALRNAVRFVQTVAVLAFSVWFFGLHPLLIKPKRAIGVSRELICADERYRNYEELSCDLAERLLPGDLIMSPEIGVIGYCLQDHEVRDVNGLASPGMTMYLMEDYDYYISRYQPRFLVMPWHNQPEYRTFTGDGMAYVYNRSHTVDSNAVNWPTILYERCWPPPRKGAILHLPSLSALRDMLKSVTIRWLDIAVGMNNPNLLKLRQHQQQGPMSSLIVEGGKPVLFTHPPFRSSIRLPKECSSLRVQMGFISALATEHRAPESCNGVAVILSFISPGKQTGTEERYVLNPFGEDARFDDKRMPMSIAVPVGAESVSIEIDPRGGDTRYDWVYISSFAFR